MLTESLTKIPRNKTHPEKKTETATDQLDLMPPKIMTQENTLYILTLFAQHMRSFGGYYTFLCHSTQCHAIFTEFTCAQTEILERLLGNTSTYRWHPFLSLLSGASSCYKCPITGRINLVHPDITCSYFIVDLINPDT
jgi:hypothetical protein